MIVIIDYNMGNIGSIVNMLRRINVEVKSSSAPDELAKADKLILPGVGAFDHGMNHLSDLGLLPVLNDLVLTKKIPILGICLGMQLLTKKSEEGSLGGLGWIDAKTVRFQFDPAQNSLKIPHMGWNNVTPKEKEPFFTDIDQDTRYYFCHSFHVECDNQDDILAETHHGINFTSAIKRDNIMGVQFHPEKSHRFGIQLLRHFTAI